MPVTTFNLGQIKAIQVGGSAPTNTNMLWYDSGIPKYYNGSSWASLVSGALGLAAVLATSSTSGSNNLTIDNGQTLTVETIAHGTAMSISAPTIAINASTIINFGTTPTIDNTATVVLALDGSNNLVYVAASALTGGTPSWNKSTSTLTVGGSSVQIQDFAQSGAQLFTIGTASAIAKLTVQGGGGNIFAFNDNASATKLSMTNAGNITSTTTSHTSHKFTSGGATGKLKISLNGTNTSTSAWANRNMIEFNNHDGVSNKDYFSITHQYKDSEHLAIWAFDPSGMGYARPAFWVYGGNSSSTYKNATVIGGAGSGPEILDLIEQSLWINHNKMYMRSPDTPAAASPLGTELIHIPRIDAVTVNANNYFHQKYVQRDDTDGNSYYSLAFAADNSRGLVIDNAGQLGVGVATGTILAGLHVGVAHDVRFDKYLNTRDDTGSFTPANLLYTDVNGVLRSSPIAGITGADNLGNHTATQTLDLNSNSIDGLSILSSFNNRNSLYWSVLGNFNLTDNTSIGGSSPIVLSIAAGSGQVSFMHYSFPTGTGAAGQVFTSNGAGVISFADPYGPVKSMTFKSANYTALKSENVACLTGTAAFYVDPPAAPSTGDRFAVNDADDNANTNNITIRFNTSSTTWNGNATDLVITLDGFNSVWEYDSTNGWISIMGRFRA